MSMINDNAGNSDNDNQSGDFHDRMIPDPDWVPDPENSGQKQPMLNAANVVGTPEWLKVLKENPAYAKFVPGVEQTLKSGGQISTQTAIDIRNAGYTGPGEGLFEKLLVGAAIFGPMILATGGGAALAADAGGFAGGAAFTVSDALVGAIKGFITSGGNLTGALTGGVGSAVGGLINGGDASSVDFTGGDAGNFAVGSAMGGGNIDTMSTSGAGDFTGGSDTLTYGNDPSLGLDNSMVLNAGADTASAADNFFNNANENDMARGAAAQASDPAKFAELQQSNIFGAAPVATNLTTDEAVNGDQQDSGPPTDRNEDGTRVSDNPNITAEDIAKAQQTANDPAKFNELLKWARDNKNLVVAGGLAVSALVKGLFDHNAIEYTAEQRVKVAAELAALQRQNVQTAQGVGGQGLDLGYRPSGRALTRMDGTPVKRGLIGG